MMMMTIQDRDYQLLFRDFPVLHKTVNALYSFKVIDPVLIDLRGKKTVTDEFLLICTCQSEAQMKSVLNNTKKVLAAEGVKDIKIDYDTGVKWAILVCGEVIIHVFEKRTRAFYSLERMWGEAAIFSLSSEQHTIAKEAEDDREYI